MRKYIVNPSEMKDLMTLAESLKAAENSLSWVLAHHTDEAEKARQNKQEARQNMFDCAGYARLNEALEEAQKRAKVRCMTPEKAVRYILAADRRLWELSTKKDAVGTVVYIDYNAQSFPSAYKYIPESTYIRMDYTRSGWAITQIDRTECADAGRQIQFEFTDATAAGFRNRLKYFVG